MEYFNNTQNTTYYKTSTYDKYDNQQIVEVDSVFFNDNGELFIQSRISTIEARTGLVEDSGTLVYTHPSDPTRIALKDVLEAIDSYFGS